MDLQTTLIGLFCVAILLIPFFYGQTKHKKKRAKITQDFINLATQQQLSIVQSDCWDPFYAIGIDSAKNKLFYHRNKQGHEKMVVVDLSDVSQCSVNSISRDVNDGKVIDKIELAFTYRNARQTEKALEFYCREETLNLNDELLLAGKWKEIVSAAAKRPAQQNVAPSIKNNPDAFSEKSIQRTKELR